jgi:hypothetical protein
MKKRKPTNETTNMIQTALWLPRGMHEKLKEAGGERGLGEEIRRRLEISLKEDQSLLDKKTTRFKQAITRVELNMPFDKERWHADRLAFEVFKAAINDLLSAYQPKSDVQPGSVAKLEARYGKDAKAETVGRILAHAALMAARDKEEE